LIKNYSRNKLTITITVLVIISLILSSVILNLFFLFPVKKDDKAEDADKQTSEEIDNRISPLTNQGLTLEINRIRHRGLLNEIMKTGISWRDKPIFYATAEIDGLKYSNYKETTSQFNTWDTITQDFRFIHDADEEQKTSDVTIKIIEIKKKGLLGLRSEENEKEKIHLTYDYRTGRWTDDDYFKDNDGYGHYIGKTFEMWFNIYQTDFDHDGIPYWTEVNTIHTNPRFDDSKNDPDNDGIPTSWEWKWGYDPNTWDDHVSLDPDIDGLENIEEYMIAKWFADPFIQDIYIEVDGMEKGGIFDWKHILSKESQQTIIERFCQHGINVYIDDGWPGNPVNGGGELLPHVKTITWDSGEFQQYYSHHFPDERKGIFRYMLICHSGGLSGAFAGNTMFNRFDTMVIGNDLKTVYIYQRSFLPRTQHLLMASTILHELGHTLSIAPYTIEGCDNVSMFKNLKKYTNVWGSYKSVMNYLYIYDKKLVDYSEGNNGENDQNDWLNFYLPFFQIECNIICEPGIMPPATDKVVDENLTIVLDGWEYSKNLTEKYEKQISNWSPISPINCNWSAYTKTGEDSYPSDRNIRIYARPMVPISEWSLVTEGYLENNGDILIV